MLSFIVGDLLASEPFLSEDRLQASLHEKTI